MNPFRTHDVADFPNVLVQLQPDRPRSLIPSADGSGGNARAGVTLEDGLSPSTSTDHHEMVEPFTVESLKAAIDGDVAASGHDTMYDRRSSSSSHFSLSDVARPELEWHLHVT